MLNELRSVDGAQTVNRVGVLAGTEDEAVNA